MNIFAIFFRITLGVLGKYVILHRANVFIVEDNILWHYDHTGSHENWFQGCKIDLKTHRKPCNGYTFSLVFPLFSTFL